MPTDLNVRKSPSGDRGRPPSPVLLITCASLAAVVLFAVTVRFAPPTHVTWPLELGGPYRIAPL